MASTGRELGRAASRQACYSDIVHAKHKRQQRNGIGCLVGHVRPAFPVGSVAGVTQTG